MSDGVVAVLNGDTVDVAIAIESPIASVVGDDNVEAQISEASILIEVLPVFGSVLQPVGDASSEGTSTQIPRLDHGHPHGAHADGANHALVTDTVAGFMSPAQKAALAAAASTAYVDAADQAVLQAAEDAATAADASVLSTAESYAAAHDATTLTSANAHADAGDTSTLSAAETYAAAQAAAAQSAAQSFATSADATVLSTANAHADAGDVTTLSTAETYAAAQAAAAQAAAQSFATSADVTVLSAAETYAATQAAAALSSAQTYAAAQAASALSSANAHSDANDTTTLNSANAHADAGDVTTLASAHTYADTGDAAAVTTAEAYAAAQDAALIAAAHTWPSTQTFSVPPIIAPVSLVGSTTQTQLAATLMTGAFNLLTANNAGDAFRLPVITTAMLGCPIYAQVVSTAGPKIFPASGATLHGLAQDAAMTLLGGTVEGDLVEFIPQTLTQWSVHKRPLASNWAGGTNDWKLRGSLYVTSALNVDGNTSLVGTVTLGGRLVANGMVTFTASNSVTAFAGGGQTNATALTAVFNRILTCATAQDSVKLLGLPGTQFVLNESSKAAALYPPVGGTVNGLATNASITVGSQESVICYSSDGVNWLILRTVGSGPGAVYSSVWGLPTQFTGALTIQNGVTFSSSGGTVTMNAGFTGANEWILGNNFANAWGIRDAAGTFLLRYMTTTGAQAVQIPVTLLSGVDAASNTTLATDALMRAGNTVAGGTADQASGALVFSAGQSKGQGLSQIFFKVATRGTLGATTLNAIAEIMRLTSFDGATSTAGMIVTGSITASRQIVAGTGFTTAAQIAVSTGGSFYTNTASFVPFYLRGNITKAFGWQLDDGVTDLLWFKTTTGATRLMGPIAITVANTEATVAALTLAVSTSGSDTVTSTRPVRLVEGDYTATPFLTLQAALDSLPMLRRHDVTIRVAAGTYTAGFTLKGSLGGGKLRITAAAAYTLASITTGVTSGTAGSGTSTTAMNKPSAAANWTASNLRGKLLVIDSGGGSSGDTDNPTVREILSNTTTQLVVKAVTGMDSTSVFRIVTPGVTVNKVASPLITGAVMCCSFQDCAGPIEVIGIKPTDTSLTYGLYANRCASVTAYGCEFSTNATATAWLTQCGFAAVYDSIVKTSGSVLIDQGVIGRVERCVVTTGQVTLDQLTGAYADIDADTCSANALTISNARKAYAILAAASCTATPLILKSCGNFTHGGLTGTNAGTSYGLEISYGGAYYLAGASIAGSTNTILLDGYATSFTEMNSAGGVTGGASIIIAAVGRIVSKAKMTITVPAGTEGDELITNDLVVGGQQKSYGIDYNLDPAYKEVTAHAGGGQLLATTVGYRRTAVVTAGTAGDSIIFSGAYVAGGPAGEIINTTAVAVDLFPASGKALNALANDVAISIPAGAWAIWMVLNSGRIQVKILT